jgi:hypothetical protein
MMLVLFFEPRDGDSRFTELGFGRQDEELHRFCFRNRIRKLRRRRKGLEWQEQVGRKLPAFLGDQARG